MHNQEGYGNEDVSQKTYMSYPKEYSQSSVQPRAETHVSCKASVESVLLQPQVNTLGKAAPLRGL